MDVKLVFFKPNGQRKILPVAKPVTVVGRGQECDLMIPLANVSRRHCEFQLSGGVVKVKDLASSNGTYVNNHRVTESALKAGDRVVVGPAVFTVQIDGEPSDVKPVKTRGQRMTEASGGVVDLEADVVADTAEESMEVLATSDVEEVDPIAALEAMANQGKTKKKPS